MLILPSRGRPESLTRFFLESVPQVPGVLLLDDDDYERYTHVPVPGNWRVHVGANVKVVKKYNRGFGLYPHENWYGWIGDDFVCPTPDWDLKLRAEALSGNIAWGDDTINGPNNACAPFIPGWIVRKCGWLAWPGTNHLFCDQLWWELARDLGIGKYRADIITKAYHWSQGNQEYDLTAQNRGSAGDGEKYQYFKESGEYDKLVEKLKACLLSRASKQETTISADANMSAISTQR